MFVTLEILEKYNACESGKKLFQRLYPNGVEILTLLRNKHIPKEVLYWGEEFLPVSEEELKVFKETCEIENSRDIYHSYRVKDSKKVSNSHDIINSEEIKGCKFITDSKFCVSSHDAEDTKFIFNSSEIQHSSFCINTSNLVNCRGIVHSTNLDNCFSVSNSDFLGQCGIIYNSMLSEKCYFSSYLKNCNRCLFSSEQENQELLLFNKPVSELVYEQVVRALNTKLKHETIKFYEEQEQGGTLIAKVDFSSFFNEISNDFWKWVKTLPNYDDFLLYQITFKRELLD